MSMKFTGVVAVLVGFAAQTALAGTNMVLNPGFEEGESPQYPGVGLHWETNDAQPHPEVDVLTSSTKHSGTWSQWLKANPIWDLGMVRQVTPYNSITQGHMYRISAWIKTANVQNSAGWYVFGIWWMNNYGQVVGDRKMNKQEVLNYDWREIVLSDGAGPYVTAPAGATRVAVLLTRHTDGDAWYDDVRVSEYVPGPPVIEVDPASFSREVFKGDPLSNDTFIVRNTGGDALEYTITDDAAWLSETPAAGTSSGEDDTITIQYDIAGLSVGIYDAVISVADLDAPNSPQEISVQLKIRTPGDFDFDGDVDQGDFGRFQACLNGAVPQNDPACAYAKMNEDLYVDQDDFAIFRACFSGPNVPASPDCAD